MSPLLLLLSVAHAGLCEGWIPSEAPYLLGDVPSEESSGLAAARLRPGVFFTHDDSGGERVLQSFNTTGWLGEVPVAAPSFVDWEDLGAGPCPDDPSLPCLFIADTGDNLKIRPYITIFVIREPESTDEAPVIATWNAAYPEGPADSEAILVHPHTGRIHLVTKRSDGEAKVYRLPDSIVEAEPGSVATLEKVADLHLGEGSGGLVTGASWAVDGSRVLIRSLTQLFLWEAEPCVDEGWWGVDPTVVPAPAERQGEAVSFGLDGGIWTTSEADTLPLSHMACALPGVPFPGECGGGDTGSSDGGSPDSGHPDSGHTDSGNTEDSGTSNTDGGTPPETPPCMTLVIEAPPPADGCAHSRRPSPGFSLSVLFALVALVRRRVQTAPGG